MASYKLTINNLIFRGFRPLYFIIVQIILLSTISGYASQDTYLEGKYLPLSSYDSKLTLRYEDIREAEQRLFDLGYWTGQIDGVFDEGSRHALIAFQKVEGRKLTGQLSYAELQALRKSVRPVPREKGFLHLEIDLTRQVMFIVSGDKVKLILPVATGTGKWFTQGSWTRRARTPTGRFEIYRKISGWRNSPLGRLYYPSYILGGIAIHGSRSVPTHPSSFGCICIPLFAAEDFSKMTPIGTTVIIYGKYKQPKRP